MLVLPPRAGAKLETLALGATEWVRGRLAEAGLASDEVFSARETLPRDRVGALPDAEALRALGAASDAQRAWVIDVQPKPGGVGAVRILLAHLGAGGLAAAGRAEAPLASFGEALAEATSTLLAQLGLRTEPLAIPTASELDRYGRALAWIEAGRLADAWREVSGKMTPTSQALQARIARLARSDSVSLGERARLAVAQGDSERARLWMRTQLGTTQDPALVLAAAEAAEERGDWARALELFDRTRELAPADPVAAFGRTRALAQLGRGEEAAALLGQSPPADPAALERLADGPGFDDAARAQIHLRAAEQLGARFDPERAQEHLTRAGQLDPQQEGPAQRAAALLHAELGRGDRAIAPAERAVELEAADASVWQVLGDARHRAGDAPGAKVAFEKARELAPEDPASLVGLSELAIEAGDTGGATELLTETVRLAPREARPRVRLAGMLRALGNVDGALAVLEGNDAGPHPELLRQAASLRLARGETAAAQQMLTQAVELEPDNPELHSELAQVYEASGDAAAAEQQRRTAARFSGGPSPLAAGDDADGTTAAVAATAGSLGELVTTFPEQLPGRDTALQVVALLAPTAEESGAAWRRFLAPKRIDAEAFGGALALALKERFEVVPPGEIPAELGRADQELLRAFGGDGGTIARMNDALGTDAVFVARIAEATDDAGGTPGALRVELRMLVGTDAETVRRFRNEAQVPEASARFAAWNPMALVLYSLLVVLAALPFLRGWGELVVGIQYASLGKGFFSIKLSRRPERAGAGREQGGASSQQDRRFLRRMRMMGRYQRSMVGRETHFKFLPARRYYVQVHGLLQDPVSDDVVGNYFEESSVVVQRGRPARLDFDFRPKECALEVCAFQGNEPVAQSAVALRGQPGSLRYARGGRTMFYLAPGTYRVLLGFGDRVLEREVAIEGFAPRTLSLDVQDESATLFVGCEGAVEPYLLGNLAAAAEALREAGADTAAALVRGELFVERGEMDKAAHCYQEAGRFEEAAALLSERADPAAAALLFERAGNHEKAALAYRASGDMLRAAWHYEAIYWHEDALECYRQAGNLEKVAELFEKLGDNYEAARTALELGDADRAIRNLQGIELRDANYAQACRLLGQIFAERGEGDLAVQKLDEAVTVSGGADVAPLELMEQWAGALERAGRTPDAIAALEAIRARDFHFPNVAQRIEALRQALEAERTRAASALTTAAAPAGAKSGESRYELLQEIGRGGMGVVFKARDKRLGRVVALKRLPDNLRNHPTAVRLFLREARAAAALNHRNIVTLFDADQEGDVYFITMEYLEGLPLHEVMARRGKLSPRDVARLGAQTATGLEYAHGRGIVHRDIKTSNLFFTKDRVVKIMDFGLAKMQEEVRRAQTVVGGTPYYMAPEQAAGEDVDHRADLYAFGVTLYELLTGEVPFRQGDIGHHHRHTPAPDPRLRASELPDELAALVLGLMAKKPADRPATTAEVAARLQQIAKALAA